MGSWVTYGIGSEARDLPAFVVLQSGPRGPRGGSANWASGFLPAHFQGTPLRERGSPGVHLGLSTQNPRAYRFYQRLGFEELSRVGPAAPAGQSRRNALALIMSFTGMPSVMQTISGTSASTASRIESAAKGGGT